MSSSEGAEKAKRNLLTNSLLLNETTETLKKKPREVKSVIRKRSKTSSPKNKNSCSENTDIGFFFYKSINVVIFLKKI